MAKKKPSSTVNHGQPTRPGPQGRPKFVIVPGARIRKRDATAIGTIVLQLEAQHGQVTAAMVVTHGVSSRSPFHKYFEWDDTEAARKFRLEQARYILRSIEVVYKNRPPIRLNVKIESGNIDGYVSQARVLNNAQLRQQRLDSAMEDLTRWVERYEDLLGWAGIGGSMRNILAQLRSHRIHIKEDGKVSRIA